MHGILAFITALLQTSGQPVPPSSIQNISFPRHHQDGPEDRPKCKGFALVILSSVELVDLIAKDWPWTRKTAHEQLEASAEQDSPLRKEARKFGFRVIERARWEELNQEYTAYRQRLLDEIAKAGAAEAKAVVSVPMKSTTASYPVETAAQPVESKRPVPPPSGYAPIQQPTFPRGCLVFVRHIHPETNKTTLRKLFAHALHDVESQGVGDLIDYVDFNKGVETVRIFHTPVHLLY